MIGKRVKALVIDDEEHIRSFLQRILEEAGYDVSTAANGRQALDKIAISGIELVLLDVRMPGMSGLEVLRLIMAKWPHTCVVMVTAYSETQTAVEAMKLGAYDYIIKPFAKSSMLSQLEEAFKKRNSLMGKETRLVELEKKIIDQTHQLQQQFLDLVATLAREHKLIHELTSRGRDGGELISKLPIELQVPINSIEEFGEALIKILRREVLKSAGTPGNTENTPIG